MGEGKLNGDVEEIVKIIGEHLRSSNLFNSMVEGQIVLKLQEREYNRRSLLIGSLAVVAAVTASIVTIGIHIMNINAQLERFHTTNMLAQFIEEQESEFIKSIETVSDKLRDRIISEMDKGFQLNHKILSLERRVFRIDDREGFSRKDADTIMDEIGELNSQLEGLGGVTDQFMGIVETAAKNFALANLTDFVDRIERMYPDLVHTNDIETVQAMLHMRGLQLISDPEPGFWMDSANPRRNIYDKYRVYADRADQVGYPELYLVYELLLSHLGGQDEKITSLLEEVDGLNEQDAGNFVSVMSFLATGSFHDDAVLTSKIGNRVKEFLCAFDDRDAYLRLIVNQIELSCSL